MDSLSQINHRRLRNYFQSHWNSTEESKSKVKQTEYRAEVICNSIFSTPQRRYVK